MAFLYAILNLLYVLNNNKDSTEALLGVREWFWREGFKGAVEGSRGAVEGSREAVYDCMALDELYIGPRSCRGVLEGSRRAAESSRRAVNGS